MATTKRFTLAAAPASSPVLVLRQGSTGYLRDDADGSFKAPASCTTPWLAMVEDAALAGFFSVAITGEVFADDTYTALFYASSAMNEAPIQTRTKAIHGDYAADPGGGVAPVEYALCSLAQVKAELVIAAGDNAEDDRLTRAINAATDLIETVTNRRLMKRAAWTIEYHDAADEDDAGSPVIWPREYPVESISDISTLKTGAFGALEAVDLAGAVVDRGRSIVVPGGTLSEGSQANELTYRPGYSVAPHDIQGVCINTAQRLYWSAKRIEAGDGAETAGGVSRTAKATAFSPEDQLVIDAYKRLDPGAWKAGKAAKYKGWTR